jgi:hypothetical protein
VFERLRASRPSKSACVEVMKENMKVKESSSKMSELGGRPGETMVYSFAVYTAIWSKRMNMG